MKPTITIKEAREWAGELRLELLRQKRAVGDPRAPMRARPGQEEKFKKAEANLAAADFILDLLENEGRRKRAEAVLKFKRETIRVADALLDGVITSTFLSGPNAVDFRMAVYPAALAAG